MSAPEAVAIRTYNPLERKNVFVPMIVDAAAATAFEIYNEATESVCDKIYVHNLAAGPLKVAINQECTDATFHDIIAGDSIGLDQGYGAQYVFDIRQNGIKSLSLYSTGAIALRAAVQKLTRSSV